jgi:hypothetical protein
MNGGEIVGEVARADATEETLGLMMAGIDSRAGFSPPTESGLKSALPQT